MTPFFYVVSYCHLSATLQTISIIVVNLQDNRAVFRIFIAISRFSFDSPSYIRLPEDEPWGSNHVAGMENKIKILICRMCILLLYTV